MRDQQQPEYFKQFDKLCEELKSKEWWTPKELAFLIHVPAGQEVELFGLDEVLRDDNSIKWPPCYPDDEDQIRKAMKEGDLHSEYGQIRREHAVAWALRIGAQLPSDIASYGDIPQPEWISQSDAWEIFLSRIAPGAVEAGITEERFRSNLSKVRIVISRGKGKGKRQYDKACFEAWARAFWAEFNLKSDRRLASQRNKKGLKKPQNLCANKSETSKNTKL